MEVPGWVGLVNRAASIKPSRRPRVHPPPARRRSPMDRLDRRSTGPWHDGRGSQAACSRYRHLPVAGFNPGPRVQEHVPSGRQVPWSEEIVGSSLQVQSCPGVQPRAAPASGAAAESPMAAAASLASAGTVGVVPEQSVHTSPLHLHGPSQPASHSNAPSAARTVNVALACRIFMVQSMSHFGASRESRGEGPLVPGAPWVIQRIHEHSLSYNMPLHGCKLQRNRVASAYALRASSGWRRGTVLVPRCVGLPAGSARPVQLLGERRMGKDRSVLRARSRLQVLRGLHVRTGVLRADVHGFLGNRDHVIELRAGAVLDGQGAALPGLR